MSDDTRLNPGQDPFPAHVFDAFGTAPTVLEERVGGSVLLALKSPPDGPTTLVTAGASRLPVDAGLPVELAVEVVGPPDPTNDQLGAAVVALRIVCDDIATNRRTPPLYSPWRNDQPLLAGTRISAIVATQSRWGAAFDQVRSEDGEIVGHVRTLRLLTDTEAQFVHDRSWEALVEAAGSIDALLDVTRAGVPAAVAPATATAGAGTPDRTSPVVVTKLHAQHPPRWVTFSDGMFQSVTGTESPEYMADTSNHEIWSGTAYLARFPWTERFLRSATDGQTARFADDTGAFDLEQ